VHDSDDVFIFGSEIKAFEPFLKMEPDVLSISSYIGGFGGPSKERTFFKDVRFVNPGTFMEIRRGAPSQHSSFFPITQFWDGDYAEELRKKPIKKIVDEAEETLFTSVRKHLIADAPIGALCSGGVDSSIVMAMASKIHNNLAIFHANVTGPNSEYQAALSLSRHLKLDLKAIAVDERDAIDMMPRVMDCYEHPFTYHTNSVPFLRVSQLVRDNGVKAILSGEGSDECYLGYDFLSDDHALMFYRRIPHYFQTFMRKTPKLRVLMGPEVLERDLLVHFLNGFEVSLDNESVNAKLSAPSGPPEWSPSYRAHMPAALPSARKMRSLQMLQYHLRTLLHRNDCLGMAASIECRFPFLDHASVRLAVNMPYSAKVRFGISRNPMHRFLVDKWVVRQIARRYLPPELSDRRKLGFPYRPFERIRIPREFYSDSPIADMLGLSSRAMEFLLEKSPDHLKLKLFHLDVWSRVCLYRFPEQQVLGRLKRYVNWPSENAGELQSRTQHALET
jgi:asparagine synthase (glutamine-hydrolysing)